MIRFNHLVVFSLDRLQTNVSLCDVRKKLSSSHFLGQKLNVSKKELISILITLLGEEGAGLWAYRDLFVSYAHVNLCHFFSSSWCWQLAAASVCGSSWTFLFTVLELYAKKLSVVF